MNRRRSPQKMLTNASNHQFTVERFVTHRDFVESCGICLQINRHFDGYFDLFPPKKKCLPKSMSLVTWIRFLDPTFEFFCCGGDCIIRCLHWSPRHAKKKPAGSQAESLGMGRTAWISLEGSRSPQAVF